MNTDDKRNLCLDVNVNDQDDDDVDQFLKI